MLRNYKIIVMLISIVIYPNSYSFNYISFVPITPLYTKNHRKVKFKLISLSPDKGLK